MYVHVLSLIKFLIPSSLVKLLQAVDIDCISDPTLTTESVAEAMELVNDWKSLYS